MNWVLKKWYGSCIRNMELLDRDNLVVYAGGALGLGWIYRKFIFSLPRRMKAWWRRVVWNQFWKLDLIEDLQIGGHCGCCGKWVPDVITDRHVPGDIFGGWTICKECAEVKE